MLQRLQIVFIVLMLGNFTCLQAQTVSYAAGMKKYLAQFDRAGSQAEFIKASQGFENLAQTAPSEWLPYYYAGLCQAIGALSAPKGDIDALCDKGDRLAAKADSLSSGNSEVDVLRAMLSAARIMVDEKKRAQKYGGQVSKWANAAIKHDASNPRAYLLKGRALLHTPEAFGGGSKKAKPVFETARAKFEVFKAPEAFWPDWGKTEVEKELKAIK